MQLRQDKISGIIALVALWLVAVAAAFPPQWMAMTTRQAYDKGVEFMQHEQPATDSALMCYTLAARRYKPSLSQEEKITCAMAYIGQWDVYFLYQFDYEKSYESLMRAREIYNEMGIAQPRIDMELGGLYEILAEQTQMTTLNTQAISYYRQAFASAVHERDTSTLNFAFLNAITLAYRVDSMAAVVDLWPQYNQLKWLPQEPLVEFNWLIYQAETLASGGQYKQALEHARRAMQQLPEKTKQNARLLFNTYYIIADIYARQGDYANALKVMKEGLAISDEADVKDNSLIALRLVSDYCHRMGDEAAATHYKQQLLELKDSIISYKQLRNLSNLENNYQITRMNELMAEAEARQRQQIIIIIVTLVIAALIGAFVVVLLSRNKRLREANKHLYQKNVELINLGRLQQESTASAARIPRKSSLPGEVKDRLMAHIKAFMEQSTEIFDSEFGQAELADRVHSNTSYVSQVINDCTGGNFNAFINRYRIVEACKRLDDSEKYGNITVEAIAASVGFKSKTSFRQAFRAVTGMNPSEYLRIAKTTPPVPEPTEESGE